MSRAIEFMGKHCATCGHTDAIVLRYREINPTGERIKSYAVWLSYVHDHPNEYEILCANCFWRKAQEKVKRAKPMTYASLYRADQIDQVQKFLAGGPKLLSELVKHTQNYYDMRESRAYYLINRLAKQGIVRIETVGGLNNAKRVSLPA